jgi:FkbM family methyltransferase
VRSFIANAATVLRQPEIAVEYASWLGQKQLLGLRPTRQLHGVTLGGFNGFSEYHTVAELVSDVEARFLAGLSLKGDGVVLDVGANLGLFSLLIGKQEPSRRIFAFEPNPSTFEALNENVSRNDQRNIECFRIAVAAHDGMVQFASREHARANASIATDGAKQSGTLQVASKTLDSFCDRHAIDRIAILKVDVEGYETLVFRGASRILAEVRPAFVYFEVCPSLTRDACFDAAGPARLLADMGYTLNRLGPDADLIPASPEAASEVPNYENWIAVPTA